MKRLSTVELALSEPTFPISDINLAPSALYIFAQVTYLKKKKRKDYKAALISMILPRSFS